MLKKIIERCLGAAARAVVKKYQPKIIAITGSVGKTSAKDAVAAVLGTHWRVGATKKNYNNELGVPLTILQVEAPGRSVLKWVRVWGAAVRLLFSTDALYPQVLVVEMGADHPGDISYLLSLAPADVGVVTAVSPAHTEWFGSVAGVLAEKKKVVTTLRADGWAVLNADDEQLQKITNEISAHCLTFGFSENADVRAGEYEMLYDADERAVGVRVRILIEGSECATEILGVVGRPAVYAVLAAATVGRTMNLEPVDIAKGIARCVPPASRMRILRGIKDTTIIDDTYNSSPRAAREALNALRALRVRRQRVAVLGDMRELGALTEEEHRGIGAHAAGCADVLVGVGGTAHFFIEGARAAGMSEETTFHFATPEEAGRFVQERLHGGDVVLVKGSQGIRVEKVVKEIMAEPERAGELLVRQSDDWLA